MPNTEQFFYQTEKNYKNTVLKIFAIFTEKHLHEILRTPIFKNICIQLLLNWF